MPQNALIYSPGFDGHRQVYVFVITHVLKQLGFNIFIAGNTQQKVYNSFYIDKLKEQPEITFIDTSKLAKGGRDITIEEFLKLQDSIEADLTIFPEADFHLNLLASQILRKKNKLRGRTVGIFMRPFYFYEGGLGVIDKLKYLKHLPSRLKSDKSLFYEFFLKRFSLLDTALCIDEYFVIHHPYMKWLPDVFQQYAESIISEEKTEERIWISKLNIFKERNKEKFLFLYFGTAQYRRGYDILLKLANDTNGCFVHCGLNDSDVKFDYDTEYLRSNLAKECRLFETNQYIADPITIENFFKSTTHLVLPYRKYHGSSGVMLQALDFGIPVIAPDEGIIGYRIKKYNLGKTYNDVDKDNLRLQFDIFKKTSPASFEKSIRSYMNFQTVDQLKKVLVNSFTRTKEFVLPPVLQKA